MDNNKSYQQYIGTQYEIFVLNSIKHEYDNIFLWKDVPKSYLNFLKLNNNNDIGADILAEKNMVIYLIQCKNYSKTIYLNDLAGIFAICYRCNCFGIIYYNGNMSKHVLNNFENNRMKFINLYFDNTKLSKRFANQIIPYNYQLEAYHKLKNKQDALLSLPCGMGKTYISTMLAKHYHNIIILSPLKCLAEQLLNYFCNTVEKNYKPFLISSSGVRNVPSIIDSMQERNIFSATYDSCDVIMKLLDALDDIYIIVDECHNLSSNMENSVNKVISSNHPKLYMSATPKNNLLGIDKECIFKYDWDEAIKNNYICDFEIILPENIDKLDTFTAMVKKVISENVDTGIMKKVLFGIKSLLKYGSKKCIMYTTTSKKAQDVSDIITAIAKLSKNTIEIYIVDYKTGHRSRDKIIYEFKKATNIAVIISVHILDEGIDIPECDSVYVMSPSKNIGNIVQRMCRAGRITNTKTKSMIYMWCGPDKIKDVMSYLNENAENIFDNKISYHSAIDENVESGDENYEQIILSEFDISLIPVRHKHSNIIGARPSDVTKLCDIGINMKTHTKQDNEIINLIQKHYTITEDIDDKIPIRDLINFKSQYKIFKTISAPNFNTILIEDLGLIRKRTSDTKYWAGIKVKDPSIF